MVSPALAAKAAQARGDHHPWPCNASPVRVRLPGSGRCVTTTTWSIPPGGFPSQPSARSASSAGPTRRYDAALARCADQRGARGDRAGCTGAALLWPAAIPHRGQSARAPAARAGVGLSSAAGRAEGAPTLTWRELRIDPHPGQDVAGVITHRQRRREPFDHRRRHPRDAGRRTLFRAEKVRVGAGSGRCGWFEVGCVLQCRRPGWWTGPAPRRPKRATRPAPLPRPEPDRAHRDQRRGCADRRRARPAPGCRGGAPAHRRPLKSNGGRRSGPYSSGSA